MSTNQVINDVEPRTQITASNLQTVFNAAWTADVAASVLVYARAAGVAASDATQLVTSSNYDVTFIGSTETVRVTFAEGRTTGDIITLVRNTDSSRTNLYTNTAFTPSMLNQDFGTETLVQQQNQMNRSFAPHYNFSASYTNDANTNIDLILPVLGANQVWAMNPGATAILAYDLSETGGLVNTVVGTANQINVNSADPTNPVLSLSSTLLAPGTIQSGNIKVNGNTITSENAEGDINLNPNGTGSVVVDNVKINGNTISSGDTNGNLNLTPNGAGIVAINNLGLVGNTLSSTDTNGDLNLTPNGAGDLILDAVKWPQADGAADQVLSTDGAGQTVWVDASDGASVATQIQMEAAASSAVFSAPSVQQYHPSAAKAWVLYNQATGPSVVASYNVTSVTDGGAGLYTVNWGNDFADTNYAVNVSTIGAGAGNNAVTCSVTAGSRSVGAQQFLTQQLTSALDRDGNCVSAYGELA